MIPLKPDLPMAVISVFLGLQGEARDKAIATGNYDELVAQQAREVEPQREPGSDDEPPQRKSPFDTIDDGVAV